MTKFLNPPEACDICHSQVTDEFVDGRTIYGPWANMCPSCFKEIGIKLGTGYGQRYKKNSDNEFIKVEG